MTAEHFKEIVEIVCKTKGAYERELAEFIGTHSINLTKWKREGLPESKRVLVMSRIRSFLAL